MRVTVVWLRSQSSLSVSINVGNQAHIPLRRGGALGSSRTRDNGMLRLKLMLNVEHWTLIIKVHNQFKLHSTWTGNLLELICGSNSCTLCQKKGAKKHRGTCRLPTIKKIQAWILKDLQLQVNWIHGSHYLPAGIPSTHVTFMDPHPCKFIVLQDPLPLLKLTETNVNLIFILESWSCN